MGAHGWDEGKKQAEEATSGGIFLKLANDKDRALVVWAGDPFSRNVFWDDEGGGGYLDADSDEGMAFADNHPKKKPAFRAQMNAIVVSEVTKDDGSFEIVPGKWRVASFENGATWFKNLVKLKGKYGLGVWAFELERQGAKGDTDTKYTMLPDTKVADIEGLKEFIKNAELIDLENPNDDDDDAAATSSKGGAKGKASKGGEKKASKKSGGVIDTATSKELIASLKQLDRAEVGKFLEEFGVKRVKELSNSKLEDAQAWIASKSAPDSEDAGEVDPFA